MLLTTTLGANLLNVFDASNYRAPQKVVPVGRDPFGVAFTRDGKRLFTVNETGNSATDPPGGVSSFSVDPATGALTLLSRNSSAGDGLGSADFAWAFRAISSLATSPFGCA